MWAAFQDGEGAVGALSLWQGEALEWGWAGAQRGAVVVWEKLLPPTAT